MSTRNRDATVDTRIAAALHRCARGERAALRVIYDLEGPRMAGVAWRMLRRRDLVEDAVQETFMRVWRAASTYDPARGGARTWIYAILRNCAVSALREPDRFVGEGATDGIADTAGHDAISRLPETIALRRCLEQLEAPRRNAVVLAYVHGLSHSELAGKLGMPLGTVKSWIRRSLIALQECMG